RAWTRRRPRRSCPSTSFDIHVWRRRSAPRTPIGRGVGHGAISVVDSTFFNATRRPACDRAGRAEVTRRIRGSGKSCQLLVVAYGDGWDDEGVGRHAALRWLREHRRPPRYGQDDTARIALFASGR